jgi:pyroglutamyl-peptidase
MHLLLTGFEPFGGSTINPSAEAILLLRRRPNSGIRLTTRLLPVVGGVAAEDLIAAIDRERPDAVISLGESGQATGITLERLAANLRDYRIADNQGGVVADAPVVEGGPAAYFATLPLRRMLAAVQAVGVPAELSMSAGTFLCNEVMYAALHHIAQRDLGIPAGFIHVPQLPEQVVAAGRGRPSMALETIVQGLEAAIGVLVGSPELG